MRLACSNFHQGRGCAIMQLDSVSLETKEKHALIKTSDNMSIDSLSVSSASSIGTVGSYLGYSLKMSVSDSFEHLLTDGVVEFLETDNDVVSKVTWSNIGTKLVIDKNYAMTNKLIFDIYDCKIGKKKLLVETTSIKMKKLLSEQRITDMPCIPVTISASVFKKGERFGMLRTSINLFPVAQHALHNIKNDQIHMLNEMKIMSKEDNLWAERKGLLRIESCILKTSDQLAVIDTVDPYVLLKFKNTQYKLPPKIDSKNCEWLALQIEFECNSVDLKSEYITIEVYDKNVMTKDKLLGSGKVKLRNLNLVVNDDVISNINLQVNIKDSRKRLVSSIFIAGHLKAVGMKTPRSRHLIHNFS